ncbi:type IV pilus biogenesis/stability protein PilW [Lysobacter sp. D1-1-M9]|uniref:type IV pilus biogenesis/stability protein PilW n=1 Tax=Novilysobacter longmucuonensis TaxID=3098603 RepID=UPI002FCBD802
MPLRNPVVRAVSLQVGGGGRWGVGAVLLLALLASGCSRLSFVRPSLEREDFDRVSRDVEVRENPQALAAAEARAQARVAAQYLAQGELAAAEKAARQALRLDEGSEAAHTLLAAVHDRRGDRDRAGDHFRRAAELAPRSGAALNNYGTWLCGNGQAVESVEWFEAALADPGYRTPAVALANAGACAARAGLDRRAEAFLRAAIELDPKNSVALGALAEQAFRAGDAFGARAFSERRLAAAPASAEALLLASQIEQELGDKDAADRYVRRMRAEFPRTSGSDQAGDDGRQ